MLIIKKLIFLLLIFYGFLQADQAKGIWVVRDALISPKDITNIINNAVTLNCNKIFLQFRALGSVYYPTNLAIPSKNVDPSLLEQLFKNAKLKNIEIHAWLNVCYIWSAKKKPEDPKHIFFKAEKSIIEPLNNMFSTEGYFLHPNDNSNLSEIKSIIKELAELYDIAGIHLDYFRYPKEKLHTSKLGRTEFAIKFSIDPLNALENPEQFIGERNHNSYIYLQNNYRNFLKNELTDALRNIRNFIQEKWPAKKLSIAVKPNPFSAKHHFLQDWAFWINSNLCDFIVLMNYNPKLSNFVKNLNLTEQKVDVSKIMVGIATYNISENEVTRRVNMIKQSSYQGYALFSYNNINIKRKLFNHLKLNLN